VRTLQDHNLWHEDRTGAAQGIEPRVPFLDHRLVELLAGIPPSKHPDLFWDKAIVREAAARFLPEDVVRRPKIGFFHVKDTSAIFALGARMAERVFPAFRESYLDGRDAIFSADALETVLERAGAGGETSRAALTTLFSCMSIAVFERLCRTMGREEVRGLDAPSPLHEVDRGVAARLAEGGDLDAPRWRDETLVCVEADVELLVPVAALGDGSEVVVLREGKVEQRLALEDDVPWMLPLFAELSAGEDLSVGALAGRLDAPREDLEGALDFLFASGWVVNRG
jgi:asparagine synthase (glutamine-hydrolysing)